MKRGRGKTKGSAFERLICKRLSLWVSNGKRQDLFWRSSMSGGRATIIRERGGVNRQAGDICSVSPEGHVLTDVFFFECKHNKNVQLEQFVLHGKGKIASWWAIARKQARAHRRIPVLIIRGNLMPILIITQRGCSLNKRPVAQLLECNIGLFERSLKEKFVR